MLEFANNNILYALLLIPVILAVFTYNRFRRKKLLNKYAYEMQHPVLIPDISLISPWIKHILLLSALILFIIALAGPRTGSRLSTKEKKGREIIIALDVSYSMLATDKKPSRLEMAKNALSRMLDQLGDDRVGLILFAGDAFMLMPLSNDFAAAQLFLRNAGPEMVSKQGTSLPSAIQLALRSFSPDIPDMSVSNKAKAIIIVTDGENHESGVMEAAEEAKKAGIVIHTIGIGNPDGVPIPLSAGSSDFRKDKKGNIIVSKLDEKTLKLISSHTGGYYIRSGNDPTGLFRIIRQLDEMEKQEFKTQVFAQYDEKFQYFLGFGLLIIIIEFFINNKKNKWLSNLKIFN